MKSMLGRIEDVDRVPAEVIELAERLRFCLVRLGRRLRRADPVGLTLSKVSLLSHLVEVGKASVGEIARLEALPPSVASRLLDGLEQLGMIRRVPDPRDRRVVWVEPTARGKKLAADQSAARTRALARALANLEPAEREVLARATEILSRLEIEERGESG
jgi:DNA-binding MarR family transcriptional regulator